jgi:hypothetical protein
LLQELMFHKPRVCGFRLQNDAKHFPQMLHVQAVLKCTVGGLCPTTL